MAAGSPEGVGRGVAKACPVGGGRVFEAGTHPLPVAGAPRGALQLGPIPLGHLDVSGLETNQQVPIAVPAFLGSQAKDMQKNNPNATDPETPVLQPL